ncbi:MAG: DUF92 domain-containing protein [Thermomicrobiales bacterium]
MRGRLVGSLLVSAAISSAGWRAKALNGRGAAAATVVGTGVALGSSWPGVIVLGTFFVSSSALPRAGRLDGIAAKGGRRDERQVLANGAVAAAGALVGSRVDAVFGLSLAAGALSAAASDTWATELGSGSRSVPRLLVSGRAVQRGTSGGVTRRGLLAALAGAGTIGATAGILAGLTGGWRRAIWVGPGVAVAGLAGSLADSLLGELVQERRHCPECDAETEARVHSCGAATVYAGGARGVDNDIVNLCCTAAGCIAVMPFAAIALAQ